jgi:hypothetical protein
MRDPSLALRCVETHNARTPLGFQAREEPSPIQPRLGLRDEKDLRFGEDGG